MQLLSATLKLFGDRLANDSKGRIAASLVLLLQGSHEDLRTLSRQTLVSFFCSPDLLSFDPSFSDSVEIFVQKAIGVAATSPGRAADPGAVLVRTAFAVLCVAHGSSFTSEPNGSVNVSKCENVSIASMATLSSLSKTLRDQLAFARQHVAKAAREAPIHGLVSAAAQCWQELLDSALPVSDGVWTKVVSETLDFARELTGFGLNLLGTHHGSEDAAEDGDEMPSFSEMHAALDEKADGFDNLDLLLSMAWQSIHQALNLISAVILAVPLPGDGTVLEFVELEKSIEAIVATLRTCRHRGVIDSASETFSKIAQRMLRSPHGALHAPLYKIVDECVALVSAPIAAYSVTRRSAGLPAIVRAVVCNPSASVSIDYG